MRLHHLRMSAFGPFAEETTIDFDELSGDGLFLLHGQTGAGKTTVLDAVAFALFGRVPGARDINRRLLSDHAGPHDVPEVEMEATIGSRRLRITRSPEHLRPKKRGSGATKVNARATLVWIDGSGVDLTRLPDIGEVVTALLGMSAEQFFQVVLLPQGDFARFLRAHSDEREKLLERLFDTERFGDIEEWLRDRARTSAASLAQATAATDRIASQLVALGGGQSTEPDMDWAQGCLDAARAAVTNAGTLKESAQAHADRAKAAHDHGMRLAERQRRGIQARARLAQLDAGAAELMVIGESLAAARRAAPIAPLMNEHERACTAESSAAHARAEANAVLCELPEGKALCHSAAGGGSASDIDSSSLDKAIGAWTAESGRWEPLARRVDGRPQLLADIDGYTRDIAAAEATRAGLAELLADAPQRRGDAVSALAEATESRSRVTGLRAECERINAVAKALAERDRVSASLTRAERALLDARDAHATARERFLALRERRLAGMAAELAAQLVDGEACVVCGSQDHPAAAVGTAELVSDADEELAAQAERETEVSRAQAESTYTTLAERHANLDAVVGELSSSEVAGHVRAAADALAAAESAAARIPVLERAVIELDADTEARRTELAELEAAQAARRERLAGVRDSLAVLDAEVLEATGGRIGVAQRLAELAELGRRAGRLRAAGDDHDRSRRHRDEIAERLSVACAAAGFDGIDEVRTAMASEAEMLGWESMLSKAASLRAGAQETLDDDEVQAALAAEAVNGAALAAEAALAQKARDDAANTHAVAAARLAGVEDHVVQFWAAHDALEPQRARHAELHALAELVAGHGQNSRKMSLRSYVLAARLEEVLVAASDRLRHMSSGRYEFVHSDAVGPRGRRGGLGIEVRDEYTGATRATTTLSGGETFFASLALALGLADVVSAEAGGRVLDTIFIDEGFGSLDPQTLDLVMGVLDELRSGGRVVGVVSHVDELRARIPAQLEVLRSENGSRVRSHGTVALV